MSDLERIAELLDEKRERAERFGGGGHAAGLFDGAALIRVYDETGDIDAVEAWWRGNAGTGVVAD